MPYNTKYVLFILIVSTLLVTGCTAKRNSLKTADESSTDATARTEISQIDSFNMEMTCCQAIAVIDNNPYQASFFDDVFARVVSLGEKSTSEKNADIIWDNFVLPLKKSGKIPPDLAVETWNLYFSKRFVSLPETAPASHFCQGLGTIKAGLEKEYRLKKKGFSICRQGSPDAHFLNAMYVYNTMWASCRETE